METVNKGYKEPEKMSDLKKRSPFLELEFINSLGLEEISIKFHNGRAVAICTCADGKLSPVQQIDTNSPKEAIIILRLN